MSQAGGFESTKFIVLRKTPYSESSLVVSGLSPDQGRLSFMVRGARRIGRKHSPEADLFRVLDIRYRPGNSELLHWRSADFLADCGGLAKRSITFRAGMWLAKFVLMNTAPGDVHTRLFRSLMWALENLCQLAETTPHQEDSCVLSCAIGVSLVYLDEAGLLPHYEDDASRRRQVLALLNMAEHDGNGPQLTFGQWKRLAEWTEKLLHHVDCLQPDAVALRDLAAGR